MAEIVLAVDLGSSNTFVVRKDGGILLKEPTLIASTITSQGYLVKALGEEAKSMQGKTDDRTVIFSPVSEGIIKSCEYSQLLLKHFVNKLVTNKGLFTKYKVLMTVPMGLSKPEKQKYIDVCKGFSAKEVITIPRIICSAYGAGINISANNAHLVVDIGGGTVDVAVINLNTIINGCTLGIGAKGMDSSIASYIKEVYGIEIGLQTACFLKEEICSLFENDNAKQDVIGVNVNTKLPTQISVYAGDIQQAIMPYINEILRVVEVAINTLPPEISADVARNGIVLTGAFANTPGIEKFFRNKLKLPVVSAENAENACILGASKLIHHTDLLEKIMYEL